MASVLAGSDRRPVAKEAHTSHRPTAGSGYAAAEEEGARAMRFSLKVMTAPYGKVGTSNVLAGSYRC